MIYVFDDAKGEYTKQHELTTYVDEGKEVIVQEVDGERQTIDIDEVAQEVTVNPGDNGIFAGERWVLQTVRNGSNTATKFTVGALILVIGFITGGSGLLVAGLANTYYQANTDTVYYKRWGYVDANSPDPKRPLALRVTALFLDAGHKYWVKTTSVRMGPGA